jgi:hypothetical protein
MRLDGLGTLTQSGSRPGSPSPYGASSGSESGEKTEPKARRKRSTPRRKDSVGQRGGGGAQMGSVG